MTEWGLDLTSYKKQEELDKMEEKHFGILDNRQHRTVLPQRMERHEVRP